MVHFILGGQQNPYPSLNGVCEHYGLEKKYLQEFECDWIANIEGAVYGDAVTKMEDNKQLTRVPYDPSLPVSTALLISGVADI